MTFLVYTAAIITSGLRRVLYYPCLKKFCSLFWRRSAHRPVRIIKNITAKLFFHLSICVVFFVAKRVYSLFLFLMDRALSAYDSRHCDKVNNDIRHSHIPWHPFCFSSRITRSWTIDNTASTSQAFYSLPTKNIVFFPFDRSIRSSPTYIHSSLLLPYHDLESRTYNNPTKTLHQS